MEVILAKSAGFCFGVRRAVNEVYRCLEEEKDTPIYTLVQSSTTMKWSTI